MFLTASLHGPMCTEPPRAISVLLLTVGFLVHPATLLPAWFPKRSACAMRMGGWKHLRQSWRRLRVLPVRSSLTDDRLGLLSVIYLASLYIGCYLSCVAAHSPSGSARMMMAFRMLGLRIPVLLYFYFFLENNGPPAAARSQPVRPPRSSVPSCTDWSPFPHELIHKEYSVPYPKSMAWHVMTRQIAWIMVPQGHRGKLEAYFRCPSDSPRVSRRPGMLRNLTFPKGKLLHSAGASAY